MSKIIGLKDLRENTESYIAQVRKGRSFTVVRRSKPIFKVVPIDEWGDDKKETLKDLLKSYKRSKRNPLVDWGPDVGREIIE